jgi:valyl-tRNA synthetase
MKIGRRLAIKILNASKFALTFGVDPDTHRGRIVLDPTAVTEPLDRAMLAGLAGVVTKATEAFKAYDHTRALEVTETYFWTFCDDYLELVKDRAYAGGAAEVDVPPAARSARVALAMALDVMLRLFAPFVPFATEEVWSWWHEGSVHRASWPTPRDLDLGGTTPDTTILADAGLALAALRKIKSEAKASMRTPIVSATLVAETDRMVQRIQSAVTDLRGAGRVTGTLTFEVRPDTVGVQVTASELGTP